MTPDIWHMTCDMWHDTWYEHSLKISAHQLLRFGIDSVLKFWPKGTLNESMNYLIKDKGVYRRARIHRVWWLPRTNIHKTYLLNKIKRHFLSYLLICFNYRRIRHSLRTNSTEHLNCQRKERTKVFDLPLPPKCQLTPEQPVVRSVTQGRRKHGSWSLNAVAEGWMVARSWFRPCLF